MSTSEITLLLALILNEPQKAASIALEAFRWLCRIVRGRA
jgi:hypothetical protein